MKTHAQQQPVLLSVDEAAAACGIGRTRLYAEMRAGRIVYVKAGRRTLIPASEPAAYCVRLLQERENGKI